jgi:ABC-type lipoprotein release transport system permease subunit
VTSLLLVLRLAVRSLLAHRAKSFIVGTLLLVGTYAVAMGNALLDSVEAGMERVVTGSLAGQYQVYAADAHDPLQLFGGFGLGSTDIGEIERFEDVKAALSTVSHVRAVVPMGITNVTVFGRNDIDQVLSELRDAVQRKDRAKQEALVSRAQRIVAELARESDLQKSLVDPAAYAKEREVVIRAASSAFWSDFENDPLAALDFLDTRIAPLASDGRLLYLRMVGTDPTQFAQSFDRFHIVLGENIPPGKPGFLFSHRTYEELIKNPVAAELSRIHQAVQDGESIAGDPLLKERVDRNAKQYRRISFQLDPVEAAQLTDWLRTTLSETGDLDTLLKKFLTVTDGNVAERHAQFQEQIAPRIRLYEVAVGEMITLRGFTRSGYLKAVNVPVYGTYEFTGLEEAGLQSASNLADLGTFRDLYGKMSELTRSELSTIRDSAGVQDIAREDAEAALFGGGAPPVVEGAVGSIEVDLASAAQVAPEERSYPPEELQRGLVLNAAIVLDDPSRAHHVRGELENVARALGLQVVDWQTASGTIGQFITVMRLVLVIALGIIFLVALIIVNNAMVMATLDRVPEIGTLRAIGAQRRFVLGLFLAETAILGLFTGAIGAGLAVATITWLGKVGLPAPDGILVLLFGGPRLYPTIGADDVLFATLTITLVAVLSTLYPARLAARVPPIVAMQGQE